MRGQFVAMPSPEAAAAFPVTEAEQARIDAGRQIAFCGTAPDVVSRLRQETAALGVDELAIVSSAYDPAARQDSYTLLAREFGLKSA
jgi:alkanesulfonate monooxygenase SsuD/methylene tetrahydromethanopterin reductase-like flavin-dependent oxidoreductase (luciferase family)